MEEAGRLERLPLTEESQPPSSPSRAEEQENNTDTGDVEKGKDISELPDVHKRKRDVMEKAIAITSTSVRDVKGKAIATTSTSTRDEMGEGNATTSANMGDEKGKGFASTSERRTYSGHYLILEVETQCDQHGVSNSSHYHFAHDCVCEAVDDVSLCYEFWNQHPRKRSEYSDIVLPRSFQQWMHSHRRT